MSERDPEFLREEWALYGLGVAVILLRFATRIKTVGIRGFQGDDFFSLLVLAFFTMDAATVHIIYYHGTNVEASAIQKTRTLTQEEVSRYEFGSKEQLAAWYSYTALIWCLKGTMLCFFNRLTIGLWQHRYVKWLGFACALSYVAVFLTITFGCYPTQKNWQVLPDPGQKCTLKLQNFLVTVVLNIVTDAAILVVPVPLLWKLKVPVKRKLIIALLLCSGLFVISAAIIRVVLTLGSNPSALNINRWGVRETIVGVVAVNLPILKPLCTKSFWSKNSFKSTTLTHGTSHNLRDPCGPYELSSSSRTGKVKNRTWDEEADIEDQKTDSKSEMSLGQRPSMGGDSREFIIQGHVKEAVGVTVSTSFQVSTEDAGKAAQWHYGVGGGSSKASVHARSEQ